MTRSEAERVRVGHHISRLRATLMGLEVALRDRAGGPPGADVAQALVHTASDLAMCLARIEAYERAETDPRP